MVAQYFRRACVSSCNYSVVKVYPPACSLGLEANPSAPGHVAIKPQPNSNAEIDLAHEQVENRTSKANTHHRNVLDLESRRDSSLSDRLVYLIRDDPDAAEQMRCERINDGLVAPCDLQQVNSLDIRPRISISEVS